ncbi:uncharacterized protein LOC126994714 [Eriocheir sinensis]|uniref:uncharacterized protein LOC126994714 n=1 Tax=Eriocheir sinensis TaxID=95602 RepID=UPI0021C905B1|nr:uncharacterized protein LOC126994714 [Eriocheir sinensis]
MNKDTLAKLGDTFKQLARPSSEEELEHGATTGDLNVVNLRSGATYSSLPRDSAPSPSESSEYLTPTRPNTMPVDPPPPPPPGAPHHFPPPPIRVIPTHASIRQFSGGETDFSARQFLDLCESAIVNSSITEDHDKIAFIRSRLLPGSRALNLMQSSAFASGDIGVNYEVFKGNFIKIFGGGSKPSIVRQMAHTVESLQKNSSTKPIWDAMIEANQLAVDCVKSLEDALWLPGGCMQKHQVKTAFELFFYLFHISEKNRRSALPLAFKPSGKLVDFVSELEVKVQEHPHHQPLATAAALQAQNHDVAFSDHLVVPWLPACNNTHPPEAWCPHGTHRRGLPHRRCAPRKISIYFLDQQHGHNQDSLRKSTRHGRRHPGYQD